MQVADGLQQLRRRSLLQDIPACSRKNGFEHVVIVFIDSEHHYLKVWEQLLQIPDALNARHPRELDVHEHDIRLVGRKVLQGVLRRRVRGNALKSGRPTDQDGEPLTNLIVVIYYRDLDWHICSGYQYLTARSILQLE